MEISDYEITCRHPPKRTSDWHLVYLAEAIKNSEQYVLLVSDQRVHKEYKLDHADDAVKLVISFRKLVKRHPRRHLLCSLDSLVEKIGETLSKGS